MLHVLTIFCVIIYCVFQREYESMLGVHPKVTEWDFVLLTEKKIMEVIPELKLSSEMINMKEFIRKAKNSEGLTSNLLGLFNSSSLKDKIGNVANIIKDVTSTPKTKFKLEQIKKVEYRCPMGIFTKLVESEVESHHKLLDREKRSGASTG